MVYYRSSTDLQENSILMQHDRAHLFALENAIAIHHEFKDEAVSARKNTVFDRPDMNEMIQQIRSGHIGTVLVYKRDRLARNAVEYMEFYRLCRKFNVQILFSAKNEFPVYYTPLGEFIELIMSGMVQHEAEQIAERIRVTHIANFKNKKSVWSLPYGLRAIEMDKKWEVEFESDELREEVKTIFKAFLGQRYETLKDFVADLMNLGLIRKPSKRKKYKKKNLVHDEMLDVPETEGPKQPGPWTEPEVLRLLSNPIYKGFHIRHFGDHVESVTRPKCRVVTDEEWEEVNRRVRPFLSEPRQVPDFPFLLENMIVCNMCKKPLLSKFHWHHDTPEATYDCKSKDKHESFAVSATQCHNAVLDTVLSHVERLMVCHAEKMFNREKNKRKRDLRKQIHKQQLEIRTLQAKFIRCVSIQLSVTEDFTRDALFEPMKDLKSELNHKRQELQNLLRELDDYSLLSHIYKQREVMLRKFPEKIRELNPFQLKELLADIVDEITVSQKEISIRLKHPFLMPEEEVKPVKLESVH